MLPKTNKTLPLVVATLLCPLFAHASIYSFDPGLTPGTPSGGTGAWDIDSPIWALAGSDVVWNNDGTHTATFGGTAGTVTLGSTTINANAINFNTTGYTVTGGTLNFSGAIPTITRAASTSTTLTSLLTGTGGLTLAGTGNITINNSNNTISGGVTLNAGTLTTNTAGSLGSGVLTLNGGTYTPRANLSNDLLVTANSNIDVATVSSTYTTGSLTIGAQTLTILATSGVNNGNISFGSTTLTGNATIRVDRASSAINTAPNPNATFGAVTVGDSVASGTTTTFTLSSSGTGVYRSRAISLNGVLSNNANDATKILALTVASGTFNTLTVNVGGANTYTGATTINGGGSGTTLRLTTGNDRLPVATDLTINGGASFGGTLDLNTFNQTVGSLNGGSGTVKGIVTNNASGTGTATLKVESTSVSSTFAGVIKNGATAKVALTKAGAGTSLTLAGTNTYTGATLVNGGSLIVDGSLAAGSAVTVNSGGILGGAGTIGGATVLNAGSKLSAGADSAATLTFSGSLDIGSAANDTAAFVFSLGASSDKIVAGSLLVGTDQLGAADFSFQADAGLAANQSYTLFESTSVSGSFISFLVANIGGSGIDGIVALNGGNIVLTTAAIPEPSTYSVVIGAVVLFAGLGRLRRNRR